jgi:phosphoglycolate phosphatase
LYALIVFDWDGTIVDSESRITGCMQATMVQLGLPVRDKKSVRNIIGLGLTEAIMALYPDIDPPAIQQFIARYRDHFFAHEQTPSPLFSGIEAMLAELQTPNLQLAVATGKGRKGLDRVLNNTALGKYFSASRCSDETQSKPHPQMLLELMNECSVSPARTIMIGDTTYDMEMANRAGVDAIAVTYGVHEVAELSAHKPKYIADSVTDLSHWIRASLQNIS